MRLSVAMCTYNGARYLGEQLASIASQQRLPDELVVCDDASTDETTHILNEFAGRAAFAMRIVQNPATLGYNGNFARAVQLCSGDMIALCDQDDVWYPQKLARLSSVLEGDPSIEGVFSDGDIIDGESKPVGKTLWESFLFGAADQALFRSAQSCPQGPVDALLRRNVVTGMTLALRRSAARLMLETPGTWIHDGWLAILLSIRSRLVALPERLVGYRVHEAQGVGTPPSTSEKRQWIQDQGVRAYVQWVHDRNLDEYQRLAAQFDDLVRYLQAEGYADEVMLQKIRAKAAHAHRGARCLSTGRIQRWGILLPHLGSYSHFSPNGLRAIPRDLFV